MTLAFPRSPCRWRAKKALRGQAIIEFALVLPLLLVLVGGACDFGVYMFQREQAGSCVREVARRAAVRIDPAINTSVVTQCLRASNLSSLTVTANYLDLEAGDPVTASIDYQYNPVFLDLVIPLDGGWTPLTNMRVRASVTMRMEGLAAA